MAEIGGRDSARHHWTAMRRDPPVAPPSTVRVYPADGSIPNVPLVTEADHTRVVAELREALRECTRLSGADLSDGFPTRPELPEYAVQEVAQLRKDSDEAAEETYEINRRLQQAQQLAAQRRRERDEWKANAYESVELRRERDAELEQAREVVEAVEAYGRAWGEHEAGADIRVVVEARAVLIDRHRAYRDRYRQSLGGEGE